LLRTATGVTADTAGLCAGSVDLVAFRLS
jgi:hypothetical protein